MLKINMYGIVKRISLSLISVESVERVLFHLWYLQSNVSVSLGRALLYPYPLLSVGYIAFCGCVPIWNLVEFCPLLLPPFYSYWVHFVWPCSVTLKNLSLFVLFLLFLSKVAWWSSSYKFWFPTGFENAFWCYSIGQNVHAKSPV